MIFKKIIIPFLALFASFSLSAQTSEGSWNFFPGSSAVVANVCPTPNGAYFLMGSNLYWYSPADGESYAFSAVNSLSESSTIALIKYFEEGGFLFVGYENGNIDLIYPDGKVVNMADLKDAILTGSHKMTSAAYADGRLFVGMDFGLVVFDTTRYEVIESGRYFAGVDDLAILNDHVIMILSYGIYYSPVAGKHQSIQNFKTLCGTNSAQICAFGNAIAYDNHKTGQIVVKTLDFSREDPEVSVVEITPPSPAVQPLRAVANQLAVVTDDALRLYNADGTFSTAALPADLKLTKAYPFGSLKDVWVSAFNKGVAQFDLAGSPTIKSDFFLPEGITVPKVNYMVWTPDGNGLYVGRYTTTYFNGAADINNGGFPEIQYTNYIENGKVTDVSPVAIDQNLLSPDLINEEDGLPHYYREEGLAGGPNTFIPDPEIPGRYYLANFLYGILVIEDGEVIHVFNRENMPNPKSRWGELNLDATFDHDGNLWVVIGLTKDLTGSDFVHGVAVLPADKLKGDLSKIKRSDWIDAKIPKDFYGDRDVKSVVCDKSDMIVYCQGGVYEGWLFIDHNGTPLDPSDDTTYYHTEFYDQDGAAISIYRPTAVAEDKSGRIWMGYDTGVFYTTPDDARNPSLRVKRPIVPRNDGTEFGDYLLDSEFIYSIAADHSDRKWFATANNGVYLVSPDGTQIIKHFTKDNSPLPSNLVFYVSVDPHSNKVYFGTESGLVTYDSDSAPAADDFSDVYAYPNPVRPEYTGAVTIAGLMEGSTVKIADAAGNVLFHARSEGGMVSWDACDSAGHRVRSGVYFVLAQSDASGSKEAVVSKIMVIN